MPVSGNGKQHWSYTAVTPDIDGEYESDAQLAQLALEPQWFPAVENRGEGVFIQLSGKAAAEWLHRAAVEERLGQLAAGHEKWLERRKRTGSPDAEGTLGGLVQEAKRIEQHLE